MPNVNRQQFIANIEYSGIASSEVIALWMKSVGDSAKSDEIARHLVENNRLTKWQSQLLLAERAKIRIGNFVLLDCIDQQPFGKTYHAEHLKLKQEVKIVFLTKSLSNKMQGRTELLKQLATIVGGNYTHLEHIHLVDSEAGRLMIVTDICCGQPMDQLDSLKRLSTTQIRNLLRQLFSAIATIHSCGIWHGALSEQDILVDSNGELTATNFVTSFLVHSLSEETNIHASKSHDDVLAVCRISNRLLSKFNVPRIASAEGANQTNPDRGNWLGRWGRSFAIESTTFQR